MTTQEVLCRHFSRIGARVTIRGPARRQREKFAVDVVEDRHGELFELRCLEEITPEVIGAERVGQTRRLESILDINFIGIIGGQPGGKQSH